MIENLAKKEISLRKQSGGTWHMTEIITDLED